MTDVEEPLWRQNEKLELKRLKHFIAAATPIPVTAPSEYKELAAFASQAMLAGLTAKAKLNALVQLLRDGEPIDVKNLGEQNAVELRIIHDGLLKQITEPSLAIASSITEARRG